MKWQGSVAYRYAGGMITRILLAVATFTTALLDIVGF